MILFCFLEAPPLGEELGNYLQLTIFGYNRQGSSEFNEESSYSSPTFIRLLKGKVFVIGANGVTIGCSKLVVNLIFLQKLKLFFLDMIESQKLFFDMNI